MFTAPQQEQIKDEDATVVDSKNKVPFLKKSTEYIASFDQWGQTVGFNYKGEDSYKTTAGGFLTILLKLVILSCFAMKFKGLSSYSSWSYYTQEI